jgi:hypothetical protein
MKQLKYAALILLASTLAVGCAPKKETANMPALGIEGEDKDVIQTITAPEIIEIPAAPEQTVQPVPPISTFEPAPSAKTAEAKPAAVPMQLEGLEKNKQIQVALKNAGLYFGEIDGKIGPLTRKAIEEFQSANGLKADGKVGPITWGALQKYLLTTPAETTIKTKKR